LYKQHNAHNGQSFHDSVQECKIVLMENYRIAVVYKVGSRRLLFDHAMSRIGSWSVETATSLIVTNSALARQNQECLGFSQRHTAKSTKS
jgi:hypothetical protein